MSPRYIFNTLGEYVAFVQGGHLFNPDCEWLGFVTKNSEVFNTDGRHIGYLLEDDRIARNNRTSQFLRTARPSRPSRPLRPLRPLRRLGMPRLPSPFEDVFERGSMKKLVPLHELPSFEHLVDAQIVAADGTLLGKITTNKYDAASIANEYGAFGGKYSATSILNQYGRYGGKYSNLSPFNQYTSTPPKLMKNGRFVAHLTKNRYVSNPIDPDEVAAWLGLET